MIDEMADRLAKALAALDKLANYTPYDVVFFGPPAAFARIAFEDIVRVEPAVDCKHCNKNEAMSNGYCWPCNREIDGVVDAMTPADPTRDRADRLAGEYESAKARRGEI
jgi:hypothetical protein